MQLFRLHIFTFLMVLCHCLLSFGQITDDFSDGDFTNTPTWATSDDALWQITNEELQSNSSGAADYYISTSSTLVNNTIWQFNINLKFSTSGVNYVDAYLVADNTDLSNVLNGYFVRIGDIDDTIILYKLESGTETILINNEDDVVNSSSNNPFVIRVTRDDADNWTLEYDKGITGSFTNVGSIVDNTINSSIAFGFLVEQSSAVGPRTNHFFDDISVTAIGVDNTPPTLNSIDVLSETEIDLTFSENLDQTTAEILSNYEVNNSIGNPTDAVLDATNNALVHLTFDNTFTSGVANELTVMAIEDQNSNVIVTSNTSFTFVEVITANFKDIVINEIFADPTTSSSLPPTSIPEVEFIELYNNSDNAFDLLNWTYGDASNIVTLPSKIIPAGGYLILCSIADVAEYESFGETLGTTSWPSLNNGGDQLKLANAENTIIDSVNYLSSWYNDPEKSQGAWTLELIDPNNYCGEEENWTASTALDGGTPGGANSVFNENFDTEPPFLESATAIDQDTIELIFNQRIDLASIDIANFTINPSQSIENINIKINGKTLDLIVASPLNQNTVYTITLTGLSDCSGNTITNTVSTEVIFVIGETPDFKDVIITEILADPIAPDDLPLTALPEVEYIEVYNASDKVFALENWTYSDATSTVILPLQILQARDYLILCPSSDVESFQTYGNVLGIDSWPSLNNSGDQLKLTDELGSVVDSVVYENSWYNDSDKSQGAWSLELIDPTNLCGQEENWTASTAAEGGTPGHINSVYDENFDTTPPILISGSTISQDTIRLTFNQRVDAGTVIVENFTIDRGITISSAIAERNTVILIVNGNLEPNTTYNVAVSGLADCSSNYMMNTESTTIIYVENVPSAFNDIIINEIYADPEPTNGLPEQEFVEIYNRSDKIFDLSNWLYSDASTEVSLSQMVIFPGEYVILSPIPAVTLFERFGKVIGVSNWPSLNNASDLLTLKEPNGTVVDVVNYDDRWYNSSSKQVGGWSLELIDPDNTCGAENNWAAAEATAGGTPGMQNSVLGQNPDLTGPQLLQAIALKPDSLVLRFNEILDEPSIQTASYNLSPSIQINNIIANPSLKEISLQLASPISSQQLYTIDISNLLDCSGNNINQEANSATFGLLEEAESFDVILNEILFDPRTGGVDFVEVYNRSEKYINLKNWTLADGDYENDSLIIDIEKSIAEVDLILEPKQYLVFTSDEIILKEQYPLGLEGRFVDIGTLPSYPNDAGIAILLDPLGNQSDLFEYTDGLHSDLLDDVDGVSLERVSFDQPTGNNDNWKSAVASVGFATPGFLNSQSREGITTTSGEIVIEPKVIVPDGSGQRDFSTISYQFDAAGNVGNVTIYDVQGRLIKEIANNSFLGANGFFTWDGTNETGQKARVGYYLVYFEVLNANGDKELFKEKVVIGSNF